MPTTIILISSSQTRDYGKVTQTFTAEMTIEVEVQADRQQAYKNLNILIAQEFAAFEGNFLPQRVTGSVTDGERTWAGGYLEKKIDKGQILYRLHTGDFMQFGVPVYEEILPQFPVIPAEEWKIDLTNYGGSIQMIDGKPKRTLTCRHVQ